MNLARKKSSGTVVHAGNDSAMPRCRPHGEWKRGKRTTRTGPSDYSETSRGVTCLECVRIADLETQVWDEFFAHPCHF